MPTTIERAGGTIFATRNSLRNPKIIAHRGYHMIAPENSLPAFRIAAEMGAWAIETDVHRTKDGVMVCMECGSCAYSCPAKKPLVQHMRLAKAVIREAGAKK